MTGLRKYRFTGINSLNPFWRCIAKAVIKITREDQNLPGFVIADYAVTILLAF